MLVVFAMTADERRTRDARIEEVLAAMAEGDVSAMGELYELIESDVYSYALSKTASKTDAEDVTHDTFVQIWRAATQYTPMGKPLAWVFTVEMNIIRKHFNKSSRFITTDEHIDIEDEGSSFADSVANSDLINRLLALLSEDEREIISLHIVSGLKHREIAKLLGKPLSTVLSKYNRAIKKLQIEVKEKEGGL